MMKKKTKKRMTQKMTLMMLSMLLLAMTAAGCKKSAIQTDADEQSAQAVYENGEETTEEMTGENAAESAGDVDTEAPDQLNMIYLMDSINTTANYQFDYAKADPERIWSSITFAMYTWKEELGIETLSYDEYTGMLEIKPEDVENVGRAMFGNLTELPEFPASYAENTEMGLPAMASVNDAGNYVFSSGDRGLCTYKLNSWNVEADGTHKVDVSVVALGPDEGAEILDYIYTLEKDDSNPMFKYKIVGAEPANQETANKIAGIPYFVVGAQEYGMDTYPDDEIKCNTVIEIPYFASYNYDEPEAEVLNQRISEELSESYNASWEDTENWLEIKSYLYSNEKYLQAVSTIIQYPNYGTYGDVYSYNYDITNQKAMTLEDGLALSGISEADLLMAVEEAYQPDGEGEEYNKAELGGFRVKDDGTLDFYLKLFINNSLADDHDMLAVYHMSDKTLECSTQLTDLADTAEEISMIPAFKHTCD